MKKILLLLSVFLATQTFGQVIYSEDFTSTTALSNWTLVNADADTGTAANWLRTTLNGDGVMASYSWYNVALTPNNYAFTPAINLSGLTGTIKLKYKHASTDAAWDAEKYNIYITTSPTAAAALATTPIHQQTTMNGINALTQMTLDVSSYAGQTIYVCFRHFGVSDQFVVIIDDVVVEKLLPIEAAMESITMANTSIQGNTNITGSFKNTGLNAITSAEVKWQVDGGAVNTQTLTGLNIANNQSYNFTHNIPWTSTPGSHSIMVWLANINGAGADGNSANDSLTKQILVVNEIFPKAVIYEEGTGPWCGWCVRGHVGLKDMHHYHNDDTWIGIAVHNGSTNPMKLVEYDSAVSARISGYPSGLLNRGADEVDPGLSALQAAYTEELARVPVGKIEVSSQTWNPVTRVLTATVTSKFALDIANANYNVGVVVIENNINGTATTYNQVNYYSSNNLDIIDWENINWKTLGNPIVAANITYQHVGRALLGGFNGQTGVVPAQVTYNTPYTYTFTHTLPAGQDETEVELVALLIDNSTALKQLVNGKKSKLNTTLNVNNFSTIDFSFYPNPSNGTIQFETEKELSISVVDMLGKTVFTKSGILDGNIIEFSNLNDGVYMVTVSDGVSVNTKKLVIKK